MNIFSPWKDKDRILLLERLELYMSAGLALDKALHITGQGSPKKQRTCMEQVQNDVMSGIPVSKSFTKHIGLSKTLSSLIEHGESSGELVRAFTISRTMLEKQGEALKKCISALVYPGVIAVFASLLTIGLVRGVMPQITPMLKSLNVGLPLLTRIIITISENMVSYGLYGLGGIIFAAILFLILYAKVKPFTYLCQCVFIRTPLIGHLLFSYSLSLFLQSLGSLVESGVSVARSYSNTVNTLSLLPLKHSLLGKVPDIQKGIPCGTILQGVSKKVPTYVPSLISAGEASGTLGTSLLRAASIIDRDMDHSLKRLTSLIEPVMMVGMGCTVGSIALSIMMPIYDISKVLQH
jgi:type II secretory pathway component PulF